MIIDSKIIILERKVKQITCLIIVVLLSACSGGGGGYTPTCVDNGRGCSPHIPTDDRGDSSGRTPSDDRGEVPNTPADDRGNSDGHNPAGGRGNNENYVPSDGRGNSSNHTPNDDHSDASEYEASDNTGGRPSRRISGLMYTNKINTADVKEYVSLGKELGLSYSNFGTYEIDKSYVANDQTIINENIPFIDINTANRIETSNIAGNVKFTGKAVGQASSDSAAIKLDGKVTLNFNDENGISTLGAVFDNWYDISVQDNDSGTIMFSNYKNKENLVKFEIQPDINGNIIMSGANMDVHYYAPKPENGRPTEANGLIQFQENGSGIKLDVAFGAK